MQNNTNLQDKASLIEQLKIDGMKLENASDDLKNDPELVVIAMTQNIFAFKFAGPNAIISNDVVNILMKANPLRAYKLIPTNEHVKNSKEFINKFFDSNKAFALGLSIIDGLGPNLTNDKEFMTKLIYYNSRILLFASDLIKNDEEFVKHLININANVFKYASDPIKNDLPTATLVLEKGTVGFFEYFGPTPTEDDFIMGKIFKLEPSSFNCVTKNNKYKNDSRKFILKAIEHGFYSLQDVKPEFKKDTEIVSAALQKRGMDLQYAYEDLKDNAEIVKLAMRQDIKAFKYAEANAILDKEIIELLFEDPIKNQDAIQSNYYVKKSPSYISKAITTPNPLPTSLIIYWNSNIDVIQKAVAMDGSNLRYASDNLRNKHDLVIPLLKKDGMILAHASDRIKNDEYFIDIAINQNTCAFQFAGPKITNNKDIMTKYLKKDGILLKYASDNLKKDQELIEIAAKSNADAAQFAITDNIKIKESETSKLIRELNQNGIALQYESDNIKNDQYFVNIAMTQNIEAFKDAGPDTLENKAIQALIFKDINQDNISDRRKLIFSNKNVINNKKFSIEAIKLNLIPDLLPDSWKNDLLIMLELVRKDVKYFCYAIDSLKNSPVLFRPAIEKDANIIKLVPKDTLKKYKDVCIAAVKKNSALLKNIPKDHPEYTAIADANRSLKDCDNLNQEHIGADSLLGKRLNPNLTDKRPGELKLNKTEDQNQITHRQEQIIYNNQNLDNNLSEVIENKELKIDNEDQIIQNKEGLIEKSDSPQ